MQEWTLADGGKHFFEAIPKTTTTDDTETLIWSRSLAEQKSLTLKIIVQGLAHDDETKKEYCIGFYRRTGGDVTQNGQSLLVSLTMPGDYTTTVSANTGTQKVELKVTGPAAKDVNWSGYVEGHEDTIPDAP